MLNLASLFVQLNDLLLALHAVINIEPNEVNLFKKVKTAYQVEIFSNFYFTYFTFYETVGLKSTLSYIRQL